MKKLLTSVLLATSLSVSASPQPELSPEQKLAQSISVLYTCSDYYKATGDKVKSVLLERGYEKLGKAIPLGLRDEVLTLSGRYIVSIEQQLESGEFSIDKFDKVCDHTFQLVLKKVSINI